MSSRKEGLGVFAAFATVLVIMGLIALACHYLGILPTF